MTLHDRFVAALIARGCVVVPSRSGKVTTLTKNGVEFYFVGRSGSLRLGRVYTYSFPVNDRGKRALLGCGETP